MRSIRRSLLGYLLLLLALALSAVGVLVDRFANAAVRRRETSETERIEQTLRVRQSEAKAKFDAELVSETKALAQEAQWKTATLLGQNPDRRGSGFLRLPDSPPVAAPDDVSRQYRLRSELLILGTGLAPPALATTVAAVEPRRAALNTFSPFAYLGANLPGAPGWVAFDGPRALARIHEGLRKLFEDDDRARHVQITLSVSHAGLPGRTAQHVHIERAAGASAARVLPPLAVDSGWFEASATEWEPRLDDVDVPGVGPCRRVVTANHAGRPLFFAVWLPPPALPGPFPTGKAQPYRPAFNRPDLVIRMAVQSVRSYADLNARLAADQKERDEQLARVGDETRTELTQLRSRLIAIGAVMFAALVLGGWFFVARGLSPLRTLSDAVSQVSEKDFRLSVVPAELGRELAPIHARLTQTLLMLQQAFAREKQAVADISHELRTPIAALLATIDVALRKKDRPAAQYYSALEECRLISKQLGQLVERIMTLASLDAGNDHAHTGPTDVADLAAGCAAVIRSLAAANNVTVEAHLSAQVTLDTDAGKLREVLMNLLHNAVEYNKPGGTIDLTLARDGPCAVFEVRDTGIGMTDAVKEKIFERFYRADASRHSTGVHAGLGLAIVKEYVARLGGTITVESEPGVGTTFRVALPLGAPADVPPAQDRARARDTVAASS
ncbi:MAG: HAMP domain-containing histidine kinase [Planctomycetes bacterium]|nr:HAMP domain-containing histidine kinase [Planctomycetota bacterium]